MRSIACCTIILRIISKVLAVRLFLVLDRIVSKNQSGFVKWRYIGDNIFMAHDLASNYYIDKGTPSCAIKIDFRKSYDSIN